MQETNQKIIFFFNNQKLISQKNQLIYLRQ